MTLGMAAVSMGDALIKGMSGSLPTGQIMLVLGIGGSLAFALILRLRGEAIWHRDVRHPAVLLRCVAEIIGTMALVTALANSSFATTSAILQAIGLIVTLGAALFFGEAVGLRRWSAIIAGFIGVMIIIRPDLYDFGPYAIWQSMGLIVSLSAALFIGEAFGLRRWSAIFVGFIGVLFVVHPDFSDFELCTILYFMGQIVTLSAALIYTGTVGLRRWSATFLGFVGVLIIVRPSLPDPYAIFALIGAIGLAARDLATRAAPKSLSALQIALYGFSMAIPSGLLLIAISGQELAPFTRITGLYMTCAVFIFVFAYYAMTAAMRLGEVSVVAPFRYTRMIFALFIAYIVFNESPDFWTLVGVGIVIGSGLYTLFRETRVKHLD